MADETTDQLVARLKGELKSASDEADQWIDQLDQHRATRPEQPDEEWLRTEHDLEASRDEALRQLNQTNDYLARLAIEKAAADKADPLSPEAEARIDQAASEHLPPLTGGGGDVTGERTESTPPPGMTPDFSNFPNPDMEEPTEVMYQAEPDPLTVGDLSGGGWRSHPLLVGGGAIALVAVIGLGIGLAMGDDGGGSPTFAPTPGPTDTPPLTFGPTATPEPATPEPTYGPTATPAAAETYKFGPISVVRDPMSTTSRYTIAAPLGIPGDAQISWRLVAPCGSIGSVDFGALVGWSYDNNTKTCPPGPQGPFPGTVTVTITTPRSSVSLSAGSETGTYGAETDFQ